MSPRAAGKPHPRSASPHARLLELVGVQATTLLTEAEAVTADELADHVASAHSKLVDDVGRAAGAKTLRSMARRILRARSDTPLQGELDLGVPDGWTLRVRREDGKTYFVLAAEASEDDLLGAEEERRHRLKLAEARVANAGPSAQRGVERAKAELAAVVELLHRLNANGSAGDDGIPF